MRVLLMNPRTGLYFQSQDSWSAEPEKAKIFESSLQAVIFAQQQRLEGVEVYLDFGNEEYNVSLPVRARG
jgi:hypothetical protein